MLSAMQGMILSNRYYIAEEIGVGGMGVVYRATNLRTGGDVAIKVLHGIYARDEAYIERLSREAQIAASLYSPRIVRVIDVDAHEEMPYLVMEYVPGETLTDVARRRGRFTLGETLTVGLEVARALDAAHAKGVVHRDLKPQNIKLVDGEVKVLDFGIARAEGYTNVTAASGFIGTPEYCAPERSAGQGDIRSDIYSLGVILFEMHEGRLPFEAASWFAMLWKHRTEPPPPLTGEVPEAFQAIIDRCLAKDPADRYETPRELVQALRALLETPAGNVALSEDVVPVIGQPRLSDSGANLRSADSVDAQPAATRVRDRTVVAPRQMPEDAPSHRRRRLLPATVAAAVAIVLLGSVLVALLLLRGGSGETPTADGDDGFQMAPLLIPGQQFSLHGREERLDWTEVYSGCSGVETRIKVQSIRLEPSGRVAVAFLAETPPAPNVEHCVLHLARDADCSCVVLETRHASSGVTQVWNTGGSGVAATGAENIYGAAPLEGEWWFDHGVELIGEALTLRREFDLGNGQTYRYEIPLLSR